MTETQPHATRFVYTGSDNLEAMTDAVNYNRFLMDCVLNEVRSGDRVLDFGAGSGTYADMLALRGVVADVLEPDADLRNGLAERGYRVLDAAITSEDTPPYDVVYTLNVLEHIKNDQEAAEGLAAMLAENGRLVVYVPAFEVLFSSMDVKVEHFRRYRRKELERILRNAGLTIVRSTYCDPIGFLATLAFKLVGNNDGSINPRALRFFDRVLFPLSRALHSVTGSLFGKNVLVVATKS